jgi:hypothetical protein
MQAAIKPSVMIEVAVYPGNLMTRKAMTKSPVSSSKMAPAKSTTHVTTAKSAANMSAT